jgi:hypothetical protein
MEKNLERAVDFLLIGLKKIYFLQDVKKTGISRGASKGCHRKIILSDL